jgi:hypothetical protein
MGAGGSSDGAGAGGRRRFDFDDSDSSGSASRSDAGGGSESGGGSGDGGRRRRRRGDDDDDDDDDGSDAVGGGDDGGGGGGGSRVEVIDVDGLSNDSDDYHGGGTAVRGGRAPAGFVDGLAAVAAAAKRKRGQHTPDESLPNQGAPCRLEECLDSFTRPQTLGMYSCARCNKAQGGKATLKTRAEIKAGISKLPSVLVVHLKRFLWRGESGGIHDLMVRSKVNTVVHFPLHGLDLSPYLAEGVAAPAGGAAYDLYGVVEHHGTGAGHGHYTSAVCDDDGKWWYFNDELVLPSSEPLVAGCEAYLLFYRLRGSSSKE